MSDPNLVYVTMGGVVLALGLVSDWLKVRGISDVLIALVVGILLGPHVAGILPQAGSDSDLAALLEQAARLTLAIGLTTVVMRFPRHYVTSHWRSLGVLLTLGMVLMWASTAALVLLVTRLAPLVAVLVGAIATPTDPVIAASIVTGSVAEKNLPARMRDIISAESSFNDGAAYPFVLLPVLMLSNGTGAALSQWLTSVWLLQVLGATAMGAVIGWLTGRALDAAKRHGTIENVSFLAYSLAIALVTLGGVKLIGSDAILAVPVAVLLFRRTSGSDEVNKQRRVTGAVERFFTLPIFVLLGTLLPWSDWFALGWRGPVLIVVVLLFRRIPMLLLLRRFMPEVHDLRDALFMGWFGPIGVSALFYSSLGLRAGHHEAWVVGSLMVCGSVVAHGMSATPLARWYGKTARQGQDTEQQAQASSAQPADAQSQR